MNKTQFLNMYEMHVQNVSSQDSLKVEFSHFLVDKGTRKESHHGKLAWDTEKLRETFNAPRQIPMTTLEFKEEIKNIVRITILERYSVEFQVSDWRPRGENEHPTIEGLDGLFNA